MGWLDWLGFFLIILGGASVQTLLIWPFNRYGGGSGACGGSGGLADVLDWV